MKYNVILFIAFIVVVFLAAILSLIHRDQLIDGPANDYDVTCSEGFTQLDGLYHDARLKQVNGVWRVTTNNGHVYYLPLAHCAVGYYE